MTSERKTVQIIRREKFTVVDSSLNDYGDLVVIASGGKEYKISHKREQLHSVFQPETEVVVGYALFKSAKMPTAIEYIAEATPASQVISANTPISEEKPQQKKPAEKPEPPATPIPKYKADPAKTDSIERQVAIKLACDISSDSESLDQIFQKADKIYQWIKGSCHHQPFVV